MTKSYSDITLEIELGAIKHNYLTLAKMAGKATCAAVVKANAYGLGVRKIAKLLYSAGCRDFFVATLDEALELVGVISPDARIYVFHGVKGGEEDVFAHNNLIPVINDVYQLELWGAKAKDSGLILPAVLHFDTGMNRLGMNYMMAKKISLNDALRFIDVRAVMSHLASADEPKDPQNSEQLQRMAEVRKHFPKKMVSFANSWGIQAGAEYHFDMVRPGCGLYGVGAGNNGLRHVVKAKAKILQLREVTEDGFAGYGASCKVKKGMKLAVVPIGYADGYLRSLSNKGHAVFGEKKLALLGRVSMDLTIFDASAVEGLKTGDELELLGKGYMVDEAANNAKTIGYEILTSLGNRYKRVYK